MSNIDAPNEDLTFADRLVNGIERLADATAALYAVGSPEELRAFSRRHVRAFSDAVSAIADNIDEQALAAADRLHDWPVTWHGQTERSYARIAMHLCSRAWEVINSDEGGFFVGADANDPEVILPQLREDHLIGDAFSFRIPQKPDLPLKTPFRNATWWQPRDAGDLVWSPLAARERFHSLRLCVDFEEEKTAGAGRLQPEEVASRWLNLTVDAPSRSITRDGYPGAVFLSPTEWATFFVAWKARPKAATNDEWRRAYPHDDAGPDQLKSAKRHVNDKIRRLGIRLAPEVPPMIEPIP